MLSEMVTSEVIFPSGIPVFVSESMAARQSRQSGILQSFNDIFIVLKENGFEIIPRVDSADVLAFIGWVELSE
jgi:hypothetical protein